MELREKIAEKFCGFCLEYCAGDEPLCDSALQHADEIIDMFVNYVCQCG